MGLRAVFVDRDGVINRNRGDYVRCWEQFAFLPNAVEAMADLTRHGFKIVVLTNQACINRGIVTRDAVEEIHARMVSELAKGGATVDAVLLCPHRPDEGCSCRKPRPGLLLQAAKMLRLDLSRCYMIGDAVSDVAAGRAAGCRSLLVLSGRGVAQFLSPGGRLQRGYAVSRDLRHAVRRILVAEGMVQPGLGERARYRLLGPAW